MTTLLAVQIKQLCIQYHTSTYKADLMLTTLSRRLPSVYCDGRIYVYAPKFFARRARECVNILPTTMSTYVCKTHTAGVAKGHLKDTNTAAHLPKQRDFIDDAREWCR